MRVLWFVTTNLSNRGLKHPYNGCGWIESLEEIISVDKSINLGVCFLGDQNSVLVGNNGVHYYSVKKARVSQNPILGIYNNYLGRFNDNINFEDISDVIECYSPDVIHIFGTENLFGELQKITSIPVVIQIQGLINPCYNTYFPNGISSMDFLLSKFFIYNNIVGNSDYFIHKRLKKQAIRELETIKNSKYIIGRTQWDYNTVKFINSNLKYFHIDEPLRNTFYEFHDRKYEIKDKLIIVSTLSPTIYKGFDTILKTASLLKKNGFGDFKWNVIGIDKDDKLAQFFINKYVSDFSSLNISLLGRKNDVEVMNIIKLSDLFIHTSYNDNSPNSVCEAQIMGIPIIASNVGGVSSIIINDETGKLIPANGIFELASLISGFNLNYEDYSKMASNGKKIARLRHDRSKIKNDLINCYESMINV